VQRGDPLWLPSEIESGDIRRDVESGLYLIALESGAGVGAARFTRDDPLFWPEAEAGEAGYVHRLAVRRSHAKRGVSAALLAQAGTLSKSFGARYLRLDCDAARPRLRAFYESFGFVFHSVATVGPHTVARYQLLVA
jgi:GNAT superfamily N-acetyltransferase